MTDPFSAISPLVAADDIDQNRKAQDHSRDYRGIYQGQAALIVWPRQTAQVSAIIKRCYQDNIAIVPQGGNTGLTGAGVPRQKQEQGGRPEIILNLGRMQAVRAVHSQALTVEAGCTLEQVHTIAKQHQRYFPLQLAPQHRCQIGGNIATNAGGLTVIRYGMMRSMVLGLEVILPNGHIWSGLQTLVKNNSGYDLKQLFIGSEGTLGVITAASLRLLAQPRYLATALIQIKDISQGLSMLEALQQNMAIQACEYINRASLDLVLLHHHDVSVPFSSPAPAYLLLEVEGDQNIKKTLYHFILKSSKDGHFIVAKGKIEASQLWRLRTRISDAQAIEGGSLKHDISLPSDMISHASNTLAKDIISLIPGARIIIFGHLGDSSLHYNVQRPIDMGSDDFIRIWQKPVADIVHNLVVDQGGSISAEHGIGQLRRDALLRYASPVAVDLMTTIKAAIDPKGIMNPGKVLGKQD